MSFRQTQKIWKKNQDSFLQPKYTWIGELFTRIGRNIVHYVYLSNKESWISTNPIDLDKKTKTFKTCLTSLNLIFRCVNHGGRCCSMLLNIINLLIVLEQLFCLCVIEIINWKFIIDFLVISKTKATFSLLIQFHIQSIRKVINSFHCKVSILDYPHCRPLKKKKPKPLSYFIKGWPLFRFPWFCLRW